MSVIVKGGGGENVTPEVTAQVPIIQGIADNFGVEVATPTGTNKQILQCNNANLQSIKTNAKKEGLYVWKKYSGKPKITAEIIVDFWSIPEIYATTYLTVTSSDPLNLPVSELDISSFDGLTITREGSDSYLFVFHGDGTTSENGGRGTFTYDKSKGRITWKPKAAWGFNQGWTFTPVIAQKENEFIDFVVSDSETAYPDGGIHTDGYWYEKVGTQISDLIQGMGYTKCSVDEVTYANDTNLSGLTLSHSLGVVPTCALILGDNTALTDKGIQMFWVDRVSLSSSGYVFHAESFVYSAYMRTSASYESSSSSAWSSSSVKLPTSISNNPKFIAGRKYTLITMA